jgi:hypothetical protein
MNNKMMRGGRGEGEGIVWWRVCVRKEGKCCGRIGGMSKVGRGGEEDEGGEEKEKEGEMTDE